MPLDEHDPGLAGLEAALAALVPMPGRIDRDTLLFRAGQASVSSRGWAWPAAAMALGLLATTLGVVLAAGLPHAPIERVVYVTIKEPPPSVQVLPTPEPKAVSPGPIAVSQSPMSYLQLERQVARWGLDGVPAMPEALPPSGPPLTRENALGAAAEPASFTMFFDLRSIFY